MHEELQPRLREQILVDLVLMADEARQVRAHGAAEVLDGVEDSRADLAQRRPVGPKLLSDVCRKMREVFR